MLSEHEPLDCAFCSERSTLVRIGSNGEEIAILLDAGWCSQLMIIGGAHLKLTVYCPTCSIKGRITIHGKDS